MNIQNKTEENTVNLCDIRLQFAESIDRCARDGGDVAETDALSEQTDFTAILLLVGILGFPIG